jgi:hypothetical protein
MEIQKRNDLLRKNITNPPKQDMVVVTPKFQERPKELRQRVLMMIRKCTHFRTDERRSGRVIVDGEAFDFQIDYYDSELNFRAESPEDLESTRRVLTVMTHGER